MWGVGDFSIPLVPSAFFLLLLEFGLFVDVLAILQSAKLFYYEVQPVKYQNY